MVKHPSGWYRKISYFHFFDNDQQYSICGTMKWLSSMMKSRNKPKPEWRVCKRCHEMRLEFNGVISK